MDTLQDFDKRPLRSRHPGVGGVLLPKITQQIADRLAFWEHHAVHPADAALTFYLWQHALGVIRQRHAPDSPLPPAVQELVRDYFVWGTNLAARIFTYLLMITMREQRHSQKVKWNDWANGTIATKFGTAAAVWARKHRGGSPEQANHRILHQTPKITVKTQVELSIWIFDTMMLEHTSFGGPAWGRVAKALLQYVTGGSTPEVLIDTAWSLQHNNGNVFNKGYGFSACADDVLKRILDYQHEGKIPWAIREDTDLNDECADFDAIMDLHDRLAGVLGAGTFSAAAQVEPAGGLKAAFKFNEDGTAGGTWAELPSKHVAGNDTKVEVAGGLKVSKEDW